MFTRWGETVDQVWIKTRADSAGHASVPDAGLFGAVASTQQRHPILGLDPVNCTPQLGVPGPWADRLPHFRMGFTPSAGEELQSEYIVHRSDAVAAIEAVRGVAAAVRPVLQVSEIRTIAADALWMSPQYGRDTVALHFTWSPEPAAVRRALAEVERVLAPFGARPHWASCSSPAPARSPRCTNGTGISSPYWIASTRAGSSATPGFEGTCSARISPGTARAS